jgi:hypothetical protein
MVRHMSATAVNERPILFSGPMVCPILDGRKTQTRRVIKPQPQFGVQTDCGYCGGFAFQSANGGCSCERVPRQPSVGDRLWVRETWTGPILGAKGHSLVERVHFAATDARPRNHRGELVPWRPSIHMPRRFSRITLEITDVRVQRLQEISEADAVAEGLPSDGREYWIGRTCLIGLSARFLFQNTWNHLNAKRGFPWESNPWVWAITFKRVQP